MILSTRRIVSELKQQLGEKSTKNLTVFQVAQLLKIKEEALLARMKRNSSIINELLIFCIKHDIDMQALVTTGKVKRYIK
ncbi:MAG: hypothetical protein PHI79_07495 [Sulfurovaceae bacterium]|nr:hypothetical protein [Sulfurovaceae bacterium]MDD5549418.1 hypothetical protein [Sulfurovaceae bacterium]